MACRGYTRVMKKCETCGKEFKTYAVINGVRVALGSRLNCLSCKPYAPKNLLPPEQRMEEIRRARRAMRRRRKARQADLGGRK